MPRVLVAEDSPTVRAALIEILRSDPSIAIAGEASDGVRAVSMTKALKPDIVTMDINMPRMDGLEAAREIMIESPTPIVVVSGTLDPRDVTDSMRALDAGALAVLAKPGGPDSEDGDARRRELIECVKSMSQVKVVRRWRRDRNGRLDSAPKPRVAASDDRERSFGFGLGVAPEIVAIAASTGGPSALMKALSALPRDFPAPIAIVQHITRGFVGGLARWLGDNCSIDAVVAAHNEPLRPGVAYLAPDGFHLGVSRRAGALLLSDRPPIEGFRPSANHLFESVAREFGSTAIAVVLTGMGSDGVEGLRAMRAAGGRIVVQDEASCVVYGMPRAAVEAGLCDARASLVEIAELLGSLRPHE